MRFPGLLLVVGGGLTLYWANKGISSGSTDPFSANDPSVQNFLNNPLGPVTPVAVGGGSDQAFGPGGLSVAGTSSGSAFQVDPSGTVNYFKGGRLQQSSLPWLANTRFTVSGDPAASAQIPATLVAAIQKALGL